MAIYVARDGMDPSLGYVRVARPRAATVAQVGGSWHLEEGKVPLHGASSHFRVRLHGVRSSKEAEQLRREFERLVDAHMRSGTGDVLMACVLSAWRCRAV